MPTSHAAFAAVANALSGVDPQDRFAVADFFEHELPQMPDEARALVADLLFGVIEAPPAEVLSDLRARCEQIRFVEKMRLSGDGRMAGDGNSSHGSGGVGRTYGQALNSSD